jgi:tripartite ATP-independent transporter DctM subunit
MVAQQSVAAVFLSTVIPAFILAGGYMLVNTFLCKQYMHPTSEIPSLPHTFRDTMNELKTSGWRALPALGCPLVVLGGIYGGAATPNEAGALAVGYTVLIGFFVYRELNLKKFYESSVATATALGMITLLLLFGMVFGRLMARYGVAQSMADAAIGLFGDEYLILLAMNLLVLLLGMFIDGIPILLIAVPLLMPLVSDIGVNLVQLGAILVINVGIGMTTPPYAETLFLGARLSGVPFDRLIRPMLYFLFLVGLPVLFLTTYIPALSCWLPTLVMGPEVVGAW